MLSSVNIAFSATYYIPDNFANLRSAVKGMAGGDTLIIRNGVYSGSDNILDQSAMPPSGNATNRTVILSENDGGAVFPDGFLKMTAPAPASYIDIIGLKANSTTTLGHETSHWRFFRCAFFYSNTSRSDESTFRVAGTYHLIEECWAWGEGRYGMFATASDYTHHIVFRRCIVRMDKLNAYSPIAAFHTYGVDQVAFQNCIVIDGNDDFWLNYEEKGPAFYTHNAAADTIVDGCIAINYPSYFSGGTPGERFKITNSIGWDLSNGLIVDMKSASPDHFSVDHITIGNTSQIGVQAKNIVSATGTVTNSIIYNNSLYGLNGWGMSSNYNAYYSNGTDLLNPTAGPQDFITENGNAINPLNAGLSYLLRVENGSALHGTGSDGSDRGATVLKEIGTSGTCWGEPGWDSLTDENLWPWPNEARIKSDMSTYSYTGTTRSGATATLSGNRGFCSGNNTLTKYIWGYLNNPVPENLYADTPVDIDSPPDVVGFSAKSGDGEITLSWNNPTSGDFAGVMIRYRSDTYPQDSQDGTFVHESTGQPDGSPHSFNHQNLDNGIHYYYSAFSRGSSGNYSNTAHASAIPQSSSIVGTANTLQNFENGVLWQQGGNQDPTGNQRGWMVLYANSGGKTDGLEIDTIGANGTNRSLKVTIDSSEDSNIYFLSPSKDTDLMPEAKGANRVSFYVRFPEGFPIQTMPYRYRTWQFGTYIHDPSDWYNDGNIRHFYHFLTMENVGDGWVKYILSNRPDQERDAGTSVPQEMSQYYDNFGRFYFQFGSAAGGPQPSTPYTIWIDEIKFYHDDGSVGGQIHNGGQADSGFDGEFIEDSSIAVSTPQNLRVD